MDMEEVVGFLGSWEAQSCPNLNLNPQCASHHRESPFSEVKDVDMKKLVPVVDFHF